jgi:dipeptide/tripeptide permease
MKPPIHWLDKADQKYSKELIEDTKKFLNILKLLLPLIPFWALFCQQFSRWIFQAVQMDGQIGSFTIRPDQVTVLNPIIVIILIPVCDYILYPLLSKIGIRTPLQKVTVGNILTVLAFVVSAVLQIQVERTRVHIAWQIPQYVLISLAEILVQVSISEFCCAESPESIKSVLQGFNSLMFGGGNLVIAFIAGSQLVESRVYEFLLFAGIMLADVILFWLLSKNYKFN